MKEQKEIDLLLGKGEVILKTRFLGRTKDWRLGKMTLHRLLKLTKSYAKIVVDEESISSDDLSIRLSASYQSVISNSKLCARIVADAVHSKLPKFILRWHLARNITSTDLQNIASKILQESNLVNFTTSITLMSMMRATKPRVMEEQ